MADTVGGKIIMKRRYSIIILILIFLSAVPAYGVNFTTQLFCGEVTSVLSNPFGVNAGMPFLWGVTYDADTIGNFTTDTSLFTPAAQAYFAGVDELLLNPPPGTGGSLFLIIGATAINAPPDIDVGDGWPNLHFATGTQNLVGLDSTFLFNFASTNFIFTTSTPLPTGSNPLPFDYTTFSIFEEGSMTEVVSGDLFSGNCQHPVVPIPAPALLLGTGMIGLACFRRKKS